MVGEDPSNAELGRRINDLAALLREVIGRAEYTAEMRGIEHRFAELSHDIDDTRSQHAADMRALGERITEESRSGKAGRQHWQQILIPALIAIVGILAELWLASHK